MSVRGAAFLGIGAMVGAGIFALLGEAGAVAGSAVWLSFLLVGVAGHRLRSETGARDAVVLLGVAATAIVLVFFAVDTLRNAPQTFAAIVVIAALAVLLDFLWKRARPTP
jgi:hypothetical protein